MITLYALDLENESDAIFYRHLTNIEINIIPLDIYSNKHSDEVVITECVSPAEIKVTVHIPQDISPNVKQKKINRIYDILKPKYKEGIFYEESNSYLCTSFC